MLAKAKLFEHVSEAGAKQGKTRRVRRDVVEKPKGNR